MPKPVTFRTSERGTERVAKKFEKVDKSLDRMRVTTGGLQRSLGVLRNKLLLASFAAGIATKLITEFVERSAKVESLEEAFLNLGKSIGFNEESLGKLRDATDGTMSSIDLLTQANNALLLGIVKSDDEMAQLFDTAQRLAKAVGQDARFGIESLVTGLGRQSRLMLDNLGIIVDTNNAYEDYAKAHDKAVKQLTDEERKTAFLTAGMESARKKVEALGDEHLDAVDKMNRFKAASADVAATLGEFFEPAVSAATDILTRGTRALIEFREGFRGLSDQEKSTIVLTEEIAAIQSQLNMMWSFGQQETKEYKNLQKLLAVQMETLSGTAEIQTKTVSEVSTAYALGKLQIHGWALALKMAGKEVELSKDTYAEFLLMQDERLGAMRREEEFIQRFIREYPEMAEALGISQEEMTRKVIEELEERNIVYASGIAAYDSFVDSLVDAEMSGEERKKRIWEATRAGFIRFLAEMLKDFIKNKIAQSLIAKAAQTEAMASAKVTGLAIAQSYAVAAELASIASFGGAAVAGTAALMAGIMTAKGLAGFRWGGEFIVPGSGGPDSQMVTFAATPGEKVIVETPQQIDRSRVTNINLYVQSGADVGYVREYLLPEINRQKAMTN